MGINPNRPPASSVVQGIQRVTFADLPSANNTPAFTVALVEQTVGPNAAGLYMVQISAEPVGHVWTFIGPSSGGGGASLPDMRFIVARTGYGGGTIGDDVPNTTYTDPDPAVAFANALAAAATYRATLQALPAFAGLEAKCTVHLHPDRYQGTFAVPPGVTIHGLGAHPSDTLVDRLSFSSPEGLSCGARNLRLLGDQTGTGFATADSGVSYAVFLENIELADGIKSTPAHRGSIVAQDCVLGVFSWTAPASSILNSIGSQYEKVTGSKVSFRSRAERFTGITGDAGPIVSLTEGVSIMQSPILNVRSNELAVTIYLSTAADLTLLDADFLSSATTGGSLVDASSDTFASTLQVRGVYAPGNNVLYGPVSRLAVTALSSHEAATIDAESRAIVAPGFVTLSMVGTPDIFEVTPAYSSPNIATTFLLVELPNAARLAPGRRFTIKNRSFPADGGAGGIALVTNGQPIDNLASSNVPVTVTSSSHVIIAPGSQVTVYVRNDRASFGILSN